MSYKYSEFVLALASMVISALCLLLIVFARFDPTPLTIAGCLLLLITALNAFIVFRFIVEMRRREEREEREAALRGPPFPKVHKHGDND